MKSFNRISGNKNVYEEYLLFNYIYVVSIFSILLFLYGFFPMYYNNNNDIASKEDIPDYVEQTRIKVNEIYKPTVKKIIIMVIDALKWDFVAGLNSEESMPITKNLLRNKKGCLFKAKVDPPTVTMPRIKAITTGSVPNFIDIVLNIDAKEILTDSILKQTKNHGHNTIFYGDDTWPKLFPNMFHRHEATNSFFVADFVEVDTNVTRHLDTEFKQKDWSMMILHYVGLDHIGHLTGPNGPRIKPKLQEMDGIIGEIESFVTELNKNDEPTLFLVMGDHGMTDSGSHGGATLDESLVAIMSFGVSCENRQKAYQEIDQIDITATIAVLLGIPIPRTNLGSVILDLLKELPDSRKLFAVHYNAEQLFLQFKRVDGYQHTETYKSYKNVVNKYANWLNSKSDQTVDNIIFEYKTVISEIRKALMTLFKYNVDTMTLAITFLCQIVYIILSSKDSNSQFHYRMFFTTLILSCLFWISLNFLFDNAFNLTVFSLGIDWKFYFVTVPSVTILLINSYFCSVRSFPQIQFEDSSVLKSILIAGSILHTISLGSSSYIEEEHRTWYYLWISLLLYVTYEIFSSDAKCFTNKLFISSLLLMVSHRVLRDLNSTGFMYADLPDISSWLQKRDGNFEITIVLISGLAMLIYLDMSCIINERKFTNLFFDITIAALIYLRHAAAKAVCKPQFFHKSEGLIEVKFFWICLSIYFIYSILLLKLAMKRRKYNFFTLSLFLIMKKWVIVSCLLHRPHNVILLPIQLLVGIFIQNLTESKNDTDSKLYLYLWSSSVFHFYQGNSNSLSTVYVPAGYVGLESYQPVIIGIFLTINTYSAHVLGFIMFLYDHALQQNTITSKMMLSLFKQFAFWRLLPMTFYTVLMSLHRYHLSVWTVFSPKLLYEAMHTLVILSVMFILQIVLVFYDLITHRKNK